MKNSHRYRRGAEMQKYLIKKKKKPRKWDLQVRRAFQKSQLWRVLQRQDWKGKQNVGNKPVLPQLILSPSIRTWSSVSAPVKPTGTAAAPATTEALRVTNTSHTDLPQLQPFCPQMAFWVSGLIVRRDWASQELFFENIKFRIMLELKNWLQSSEFENQDSGKPWP